MTLLLCLGSASSPQVHRSRSVDVVYRFVKCTMIPGVDLELNLRTFISIIVRLFWNKINNNAF